MRPRTLLPAAALLGLLALAPHARAQEPAAPAAPRGADPAALRQWLAEVEGPRKKDADAWYQLGIAYNLAGDTSRAREAFRQAVKLRSDFYNARAGIAYTYFVEGKLDEAERIARNAADDEIKDFLARPRGSARRSFPANSVYSAVHVQKFYNACAAALAEAEKALAEGSTDARWHLLKARALIGMSVGPQKIAPDLTPRATPPTEAERAAAREAGVSGRKLLADAIPHLEEYLRRGGPKGGDRERLTEQLAALRYYAGLSGEGGPPLSSAEVTTKAVITSKPEPGYTEQARKNNVEGMVRLRAVLAADGTVRHILALKTLPDGLTEKALEAARRVKFRPAVKDGQPVPAMVQLEYNFNVY